MSLGRERLGAYGGLLGHLGGFWARRLEASVVSFPSDVADVLTSARRLCPYLHDRTARGLSPAFSLGPGIEDQCAHASALGAAGVQGKTHVRDILAHRGLLPRGLSPTDFVLCASWLSQCHCCRS